MSVLQDGSEGTCSSSKREQSAAIDIPAPCNKDSVQDSLRTRSGTQDFSKSTDSTPKGAYGNVPSKLDEDTPPRPLPVGGEPAAVFERRYSEPVDVIGARAVVTGGAEPPESGGGDERERKERIGWSKSAHQLVTSSLPNSSSVAIQIEVGWYPQWFTFSVCYSKVVVTCIATYICMYTTTYFCFHTSMFSCAAWLGFDDL